MLLDQGFHTILLYDVVTLKGGGGRKLLLALGPLLGPLCALELVRAIQIPDCKSRANLSRLRPCYYPLPLILLNQRSLTKCPLLSANGRGESSRLPPSTLRDSRSPVIGTCWACHRASDSVRRDCLCAVRLLSFTVKLLIPIKRSLSVSVSISVEP
jgi:hypothetical protein